MIWITIYVIIAIATGWWCAREKIPGYVTLGVLWPLWWVLFFAQMVIK